MRRPASIAWLGCLCAVAAFADGVEPPAEVDVIHKSRGVRPEERPFYQSLLDRASTADPEDLSAAAGETVRRRADAIGRPADRSFPLYRDLIRTPAAYEGEPVTFRGRVRRVAKIAADPDRWESWLFPDEADGNPVVVVSADPPGPSDRFADVGLFDPLDVGFEAEATGLFLKLYGYEAADGPRFAPLILAGPVRVLSTARRGPVPDWAIYAVGAVTGLYATWRIATVVGRLRPRSSRAEDDLPDELPDAETDRADA